MSRVLFTIHVLLLIASVCSAGLVSYEPYIDADTMAEIRSDPHIGDKINKGQMSTMTNHITTRECNVLGLTHCFVAFEDLTNSMYIGFVRLTVAEKITNVWNKVILGETNVIRRRKVIVYDDWFSETHYLVMSHAMPTPRIPYQQQVEERCRLINLEACYVDWDDFYGYIGKLRIKVYSDWSRVRQLAPRQGQLRFFAAYFSASRVILS